MNYKKVSLSTLNGPSFRTKLKDNSYAEKSESTPVENHPKDKCSLKVPKTIMPKCPDQVQAHLNHKGSKLIYESKLTGPNDTIQLNTDSRMVPKVTPQYLVDAEKVLNGTLALNNLSSRSRGPAGTIAKRKLALNQDNISKSKVDYFGKNVQISPLKLMALAKAAHMGLLLKDKEDHVAFCFAGHWVREDQIQGDHAYPGPFIVERLFTLFPQVFKDGNVPQVFKYLTNETTPNKTALMYHYLEPKNLISMCKFHNGNKQDQFIEWLLTNERYGLEFINQEFPLDYSTIVPRTKTKQGLGDAMMVFIFNKKAISEALNFNNSLPIKTEEKKSKSDDESMAIETVRVLGAQKLTKKEQQTLNSLLNKLTIQ